MNRWTRRRFLAGSVAAVASPALVRAAPQAEVDAIVIGAGAAGVACARRLAAHGRRFALLEASGQIGGRCVTDTRTFGVPFDRGAHWIYAPDSNPVTKLAARTGLDIYPAPRGQRVRIGRRNAREGELEDFLATLVTANRAIQEAARGRSDVSVAQALPKDLGDWRGTVEFQLGPYTCGRDLTDVSALDLSRSAERDVSAFCRQGFGTLLAKLAEGITVQRDTAATRIDTGGPGVRVTTSKGVLSGRYAVVTASAGVLAAGKIAFAPDLPRRQTDAFGRLALGSLDHIALEVSGNPFGLQRDDLVFEKSDGPRTAALLANVSGTRLAIVEVGGGFGRGLAAQGEKAMVEFALEWLGALYGPDVRAAVRRSHATRWNHEPWALGAMSVAAPGAQGARKILMEPVRDRIFFAGEAAHETLWGTVGGAWESGERAADTILRRLGVLKEQPAPKREENEAPRRRRQRRRR